MRRNIKNISHKSGKPLGRARGGAGRARTARPGRIGAGRAVPAGAPGHTRELIPAQRGRAQERRAQGVIFLTPSPANHSPGFPP